ncbi:MAG: hypothetical protein ACT4OE_09635 [Sphingosinicella sp.]
MAEASTATIMPARWVAFGVLAVGLLSLALTPLLESRASGFVLVFASVAAAFALLALAILIGFRDAATRGRFLKWLAVEAALALALRLLVEFLLWGTIDG